MLKKYAREESARRSLSYKCILVMVKDVANLRRGWCNHIGGFELLRPMVWMDEARHEKRNQDEEYIQFDF